VLAISRAWRSRDRDAHRRAALSGSTLDRFVISYNVTQRVHEIGVRIALGARRGDIVKLILLMVARVAAAGLVIGLCGSILLERIVRFQVFAKTSFDAPSLAMVVIALSVVALLAAWLPASRAGHLKPVTALRHDA
jgi:putative ABC transport system permease protein